MILTCTKCKNTIEATITDLAPDNAVGMECSYCPDCEGSHDDFWEEWYIDQEGETI